MLPALLVLEAITLLAVIALWLRKPVQSAAPQDDARLAQLDAQLTRLDARTEALASNLRGDLAQLRNDAAAEATRSRDAAEAGAAGLRTEVLQNISTLSNTLKADLEDFRRDNKNSGENLRLAVDALLRQLSDKFSGFATDNAKNHADAREALHQGLDKLTAAQTEHQEKLRTAVEGRLDKLNADNTAKLEEMRSTVDEKLHNTLQTRLTESFGAVTDQLTKVHAGLGEMTKLSAGVDDLSRIFTNVKSRGTIGEVLLESLLKQMLAPSQFVKNPKIKPGSGELVEFAVKLPTPGGETLLPIDSKFPREIWEPLETAYSNGNSVDIQKAGRAFETAIRHEGRKICDKYIAPPTTTSFAIMFLPTEGLYAEVMRRDGLQAEIQQSCHVTIAGPSTLSAILSSFQMGFHMLQLQQKGDDVWKVLARARKEFSTFETLMEKMSADVGRVQGTIDKLGTRTRAINRTLRDVGLDAEGEPQELPLSAPTAFDGLLPMLAAGEEEQA